MSNLDDLKAIKRIDRSGMLRLLESFPEQCEDANRIGYSFRLPDSYRRKYNNVVVAGLGGSAIGADIVRSYLADETRSPIFVNRNYGLPAFVGAGSLVVVSSYSGDTEETLASYAGAKKKRAAIVAITSGGKLKAAAGKDGYPVITIPGRLPPRAALGYSSIPLLILLAKAGLAGDKREEIDGAIGDLRRLGRGKIESSVSARQNMAKKAAAWLHGRFPVVYSAQDHIDAVATRWRGQLAENSKTLASVAFFPEASHNEIVGWENPRELLRNFAVVMLRDRGDNRRVAKRMDITKDILKGRGMRALEINSEGKGLLARIFSLIYIGDFVSFYLAILNRCDPTPVNRIKYLKKEMAKDY
jgi:glucose/mannose-6-phosphate isomerase